MNAFYHRDYLSCQSVIIEIEPECIRIINFPGIDRSVPQKAIEEGERFCSRYYRNKRLGEFLKELDLSEGRSTGIPTIQEELRNNGSPKARFFTDEDRRAVTVEIPIHGDFVKEKVAFGDTINGTINETTNETINLAIRLNETEKRIIEYLKVDKSISRKELSKKLHCAESTISRNLENLVGKGLVARKGAKKNGYWEVLSK